jgi:hypothetical protein
MTTFIQFSPTPTAPFQFQATFDNASYNVIVTSNYFGQRYYLNVYSIQGVLQYCLPLIGSPDDYSININAGYFSTPLVFRVSSGNFEIG